MGEATYFVGVIPDEFATGLDMRCGEERHPREPNVPRFEEHILHEDIRRTRMIVESRDVAFQMRVHDENARIVVGLLIVQKCLGLLQRYVRLVDRRMTI